MTTNRERIAQMARLPSPENPYHQPPVAPKRPPQETGFGIISVCVFICISWLVYTEIGAVKKALDYQTRNSNAQLQEINKTLKLIVDSLGKKP